MIASGFLVGNQVLEIEPLGSLRRIVPERPKERAIQPAGERVPRIVATSRLVRPPSALGLDHAGAMATGPAWPSGEPGDRAVR